MSQIPGPARSGQSAVASAPTPPATSAAPSAGPTAPAAKPAQPTEFPPPVAKTIAWLNTTYAHWYHQNPPAMPDRHTRREFGFMLWPERPGPPPFFRHRAYETAAQFHDYLARAGPHSVYYSTAYYRRPGDMKMVDKQWLGAELIFDLDADHLEEVEKANAAAKEGHGTEMPLAEQLAKVKVQFKRLLDDYLFGDFGLSAKDVWITFSGGRGYHAHVVHEAFMQLGSRERREVVDYVTGKFPQTREGEVRLGEHVRSVLVDTKGRAKFAKGVYQVQVPTAHAPGWGGRLTARVVRLLDENVAGQPRHVAAKWLQALEGIGPKRAQEFLDKYTDEVRSRLIGVPAESSVLLQDVRPTTWTALSAENSILEAVYKHAAVELGIQLERGETDEPVTADVKRLIRLPGSLHGKSGLRVVPLTRDQLDGFEPLRDAVAFPMDPVTIVPRRDQEATLGGERVAVKAGAPVPVPMQHAVFWLARQGGTIVT